MQREFIIILNNIRNFNIVKEYENIIGNIYTNCKNIKAKRNKKIKYENS